MKLSFGEQKSEMNLFWNKDELNGCTRDRG